LIGSAVVTEAFHLARVILNPVRLVHAVIGRVYLLLARYDPRRRPLIRVTRGWRLWHIMPRDFELFAFRSGDTLTVLPPEPAETMRRSWGDWCLEIAPGRTIRVPPRYDFFDFKGFSIPVHLIALTGAGPESFDIIGKHHVAMYRKHVGLLADMTVLEIGCGIGRDAFQLFDVLGPSGRYVGVDVTRDSIEWCRRNITPRYPHYSFHHLDVHNELYNPFGRKSTTEVKLPVPDASVDRIVLASVLTHLLEDEVLHYMREFRRVLKADGLVYANFFLYTVEALEAAKAGGNTAWPATFALPFGDGVYGNDPDHPRGAVAYTDAAMRRLARAAGLRITRPYLKGWWSGLHGDEAEDGQDAVVLAVAA
jgi:SAM-dependent methyltransferase